MQRAWLVCALAAAACGKSDAPAASGSGAAPASGSAAAVGSAAPAASGPREAAIAAWKQGGLDVSAFAPTTTSVGKDCAVGQVARVDVLVCAFGSPDEAKRAAEAGLAWVGSTTGSSQARGALVIAVADRQKADPNGRTINQIFKLAPS